MLSEYMIRVAQNRHDKTKLDEQDFDEKDVEVLIHKTCVDSDEEEVPPVPPQREVSCMQWLRLWPALLKTVSKSVVLLLGLVKVAIYC